MTSVNRFLPCGKLERRSRSISSAAPWRCLTIMFRRQPSCSVSVVRRFTTSCKPMISVWSGPLPLECVDRVMPCGRSNRMCQGLRWRAVRACSALDLAACRAAICRGQEEEGPATTPTFLEQRAIPSWWRHREAPLQRYTAQLAADQTEAEQASAEHGAMLAGSGTGVASTQIDLGVKLEPGCPGH